MDISNTNFILLLIENLVHPSQEMKYKIYELTQSSSDTDLQLNAFLNLDGCGTILLSQPTTLTASGGEKD